MAPRKYQMDRRKAAAEDTRGRIVEAAVGLHAEKGALATTWQDIARRADVAVGTVYHHFPSLHELLPACTGYGLERHPPPSAEMLEGVVGTAARVRRVVAAWFSFYDATAPWLRWYGNAPNYHPVMRQAQDRWEAWRKGQLEEALGPNARQPLIRVLMTLTEFSVWPSLATAGLSTEAAAEEISGVLNTWLDKVAGRGNQAASGGSLGKRRVDSKAGLRRQRKIS
jgi:AcrR family transcriptional regulator